MGEVKALLPEEAESLEYQHELKAWLDKHGFGSCIMIVSTADECICDKEEGVFGRQTTFVVGHGCLLVKMIKEFANGYPELWAAVQEEMVAEALLSVLKGAVNDRETDPNLN